MDEATRYARIRKDPASFRVPPNLVDYEAGRASFRWDAARAGLTGLPGGAGLNIAYEAVDRHARGEHASRVALRCIGKTGERRDLTYGELVSIGSSRWDSARFRGFWSLHVRFRNSQSRLKGQGRACDSLDENEIAVEKAAVDRPVDEFHFECQIRVRQSQLNCPNGHFSLSQALEFERRASPTLNCQSTVVVRRPLPPPADRRSRWSRRNRVRRDAGDPRRRFD
ncbi:MAG TPA: hypothetical protein VIH63_01440 [Xanthobacteraceae bacterium]